MTAPTNEKKVAAPDTNVTEPKAPKASEAPKKTKESKAPKAPKAPKKVKEPKEPKQKQPKAAKPKGALGAHVKKFSVWTWLSAVCSLLMIVLLFMPWLGIPTEKLTAQQVIRNELVNRFDVDITVTPVEKETTFEELDVDPAEVVKALEKKNNDFFFNVPDDMKADFPKNIKTVGELAKVYDVEHYPVTLVPDLLLKSFEKPDLMIFLIPLLVGVLIVHVLYLVSLFRPGHEAIFPGTVAMLLVGITLFVFIFASDAAFSLVVKSSDPESFTSFSGIDKWTWAPFTWFIVGFLQKLWFARIAHKKAPSK